jgi:hypothetical protein
VPRNRETHASFNAAVLYNHCTTMLWFVYGTRLMLEEVALPLVDMHVRKPSCSTASIVLPAQVTWPGVEESGHESGPLLCCCCCCRRRYPKDAWGLLLKCSI